MPRPARVRSKHAYKRRAFAVIAALSAIAVDSAAAAQPAPTAAVL